MLDCSISRVYRFIEECGLPYFKIDREHKFYKDAVEVWMDSHETEAYLFKWLLTRRKEKQACLKQARLAGTMGMERFTPERQNQERQGGT